MEDDLELWLPADLLTDDDIVNDFKTDKLSSSSDGDGAIAELRAVLARSTIEDSNSSSTEVWKTPDSPQSTLCGYKSDCKGTANSISPFYSTALFPPLPNSNSFFTTPNQYQLEFQARVHYQQQQFQNQMRQREIRRNGGRIKQPGSGMRAVFLEEPGSSVERKGTGVFMPRVVNSNLTEIRKKPGCSAVLLPERVIHTLNLNVDSIDPHVLNQNHPIANGSFIYKYGNN